MGAGDDTDTEDVDPGDRLPEERDIIVVNFMEILTDLKRGVSSLILKSVGTVVEETELEHIDISETPVVLGEVERCSPTPGD